MRNAEAIISERRQKVWTLLTRGMKRHEIAKELGTDHSTISRDIKYLTEQSQNYLNDLGHLKCRYFGEYGRIENEEVIEKHNKFVESCKVVDPPSEEEMRQAEIRWTVWHG